MATQGRYYSMEEWPIPDTDDTGQTIMWDDEGADGEWEVVVVQAEGEGWREVVGAVAQV